MYFLQFPLSVSKAPCSYVVLKNATNERTTEQALHEIPMGLLPGTWNCGLRMRRKCRKCRERFPRHRFQWKSLVSDPGVHNSTCVTYVPWCLFGSLTRDGGENVPGIPGACTTHSFTYLARGPWRWLLLPMPDQYITLNQISMCFS